MHLGSNHGSQLFDDKNKLNKAFLKEVLSQYFNQSDLKVHTYLPRNKKNKFLPYIYIITI